MKLIIFAIVMGVCSADVSHLTRGASYLPPHASGQYNSGASSYSGAGSFNAGPSSYNGGAAHQAGAGAYQTGYNGGAAAYSAGGFSGRSQDINAHTLRESSDVNDHGFAYDFETSNGIKAQQHGEATNGVQSQGAFSYKGDDGHDYSITYTADENGYRPQGAHLPTPPPVPEEILRSLEQNARDEAAGIHNEGSYNEQYDGAGSSQYSSARYSAQPSRQYLAPVVAQRTSSSFNAQSGYRY